MTGEAGNDIITGSGGNDIIDGGTGNDTLYGNAGADTIKGGAGDDTIIADSETNPYGTNAPYNDILEGGTGNDTLQGGAGDDTYIFNRGDGVDTIHDYDSYRSTTTSYNAGNDTLQFGEGISADDLILISNGNDLIVGIREEGVTSWADLTDRITITNWYNTNNKIENFKFRDGSSMTSTQIADAAANSGEFSAPLVLDLNHNDSTSTSLETSNAYFDYDGDGDREHTAWMESGDGILAMDINNDGAISNGSELFGDFTKLADGTLAKDGYEALAQYDSNGDNIIDKNDSKFNDLLLWKDSNGDGKSTKDELISLQLSSVTAIHLSRENGITFEEFTENGNIITNETTFDGHSTTGTVRDVWFKYDSNDSVSGNDDIYRFNLGDGKNIIDDNDLSGAGVDKLILGSGIVAEQVLMKWDRGTDDLIIGIREHSEDNIALNSLDDQIRIKDWFKDSGLIETIELSDGTTLDRDAIYNQLLSARENGELTLRVLDEGNELNGADYNDVLYGASGDESLSGKNGDDYLKGQEGDDLLNGGKGDDTINGGSGDDTLVGESGDDFYIYEKGDGRDTVIDSNGVDSIVFGEGISRKDVLFRVSGDDMILTFEYDSDLAEEDRDSILITNFEQSEFEIENLEFSSGESYSIAELIEKNTNHAPTTLFAESSYTLSDVSLQTGIVLARDIDGDTLNYTVSTSPEHGEVSINTFGIWTYKTNDKYRGLDSATITIDDGNGLSTTKILNFEVVVTNVDPIVIEAESNVLLQDVREQSGDIGATDEDGDTLTYTVSTDVQHGTLSIDENGTWTYNVEGTYMGEDTAIITVDDGNGGSVTKTLNFDSKVSTPTLSDSTNELLEDNSSNGIFNVVNPVGGVLTYEVVNQTTNGAFSVESDGTYNYNPSQDYNGTDAVTIKVTNQYGLSTTSTLTFDIEAVNDAPTVQSIDTTNLLEDSILITGQINANDVDNNSVLSYTAATIAGFTLNDDGSYSFDASNEAYQHLADGALETVTIPVTITDEHSASVTTDIVFEITGTNDKPLIADITAINTAEDASLVTGNITSTDVDDNSTATYSITDSVAGFILNIDGSYSFNPADEAYQSLAKDEIQEITIAVTVTDDKDATDTKDLVIRVVGTNDAPTVLNANESFTLQNIRNIDGQVEASDIDGDTLNYSVLTDAQNGIVTVDENGNWHYKADASFNGNDTATILVDDGNGGSVTSILNFTVDGYIYKGGDLVIDEASGNDTLSMSNINKDSLSFTRTSDDLQITVIDEGIITIKNYFINTQAGVESLQTAQGDINLSRDVINDVTSGWWCSSFIVRDTQDNLISGTESSDYIRGNSGDDIIFGNSRYDYISGRDGNDLLVGGSERDYLFGGRGDDNLYGDSGNDRLFGGRGNDALIGATGNDRLYGGKGDDLLFGGEGNDILEGETGSDTYYFNIGDGQDTIDDYSKKDSTDVDKIIFGKDITLENISMTRDKYDLILQVNESDSIKVKYWFGSDNRNKIEQIEFADHTTLSIDDVKSMIVLEGTDGNNTLKGLDSLDDIIYAFGGKDRLYGYEGDDFLSGGSGKDKLYGAQGDDTLVGGEGDDKLDGYKGSDTYIFNQGDGNDTITDYSKKYSDDIDKIVFGEDITKDDISFIMKRGDLLIQYGDNDTIKVKDQDSTRNQIELIELSDGNYLTNDDIDLVIQQINSYGQDNGMYHINNNDIQNNQDLMNIVSSAWNT